MVSYLAQPEDDGCLAAASGNGDAGDAGEGSALRGHALVREFEKADESRRLTLFLTDLVQTVVANVCQQCVWARVSLASVLVLASFRPARIRDKEGADVRRETSR